MLKLFRKHCDEAYVKLKAKASSPEGLIVCHGDLKLEVAELDSIYASWVAEGKPSTPLPPKLAAPPLPPGSSPSDAPPLAPPSTSASSSTDAFHVPLAPPPLPPPADPPFTPVFSATDAFHVPPIAVPDLLQCLTGDAQTNT